jgi:pilus assembly protein CpaF
MGLIDRIREPKPERVKIEPSLLKRAAATAHEPVSAERELFDYLKERVQDRIFQRTDPAKLEEYGPTDLLDQISGAINEIITQEKLLLTDADRDRLIQLTINDMVGLGPLEPLLQDNEISDILVNGYAQTFIERRGKLVKSNVKFHDDQHLLRVINRIVARVGRRIDESSPMVDARLPDGSRVNAVIGPLAIDGPSLSIRRFGGFGNDISQMVLRGTLTAEMVAFMRAAVGSRLNILISGGTGTGKTTMLNCFSSFIPEDERIITIEDAAELRLQQPHVVRLESRPPNVEGKGEITQRDLFKNTLRMRPDRIVVGEVRGGEVLDMLQAMSTGHDGSMATIHANTPRDSLGRLEMMMLLTGISLPDQAMRQYIVTAINLVVHVNRFSDGSRRVVKISEITGMETGVVLMQDLFEFVRTGTGPTGKVLGEFRSTGVRSKYTEKMLASGYPLSAIEFERTGA